MGALFSYSLVASLFVMLLYPVASLVVSHSTSFRFNRIFLFVILGLCLFLPLVVNTLVTGATTLMTAKEIIGEADGFAGPLEGNSVNSVPAWQRYIGLAVMIYVVGVGVMLIREMVSYLRLYNIIRRSERIDKDEYILCLLPDSGITPFSWGRYIFLAAEEYAAFPDEILLHEKAHVECGHWIDVLLCDFICILLWYNPFVWKTRDLVKLNNEFQADSGVIATGINPYDYQCLLLSTVMDRKALGVANSFGSDRQGFRKRVLAIGGSRSSRKGVLVSLWAIPALAAGLFVTSLSLSGRVLEEISTADVLFAVNSIETDESGVEAVTGEETRPMAQFEGGEAALYDFLIRNTVYPEVPEQEMSVRHMVRVLFDVTKEGHIANIRVKNPKGSPFEEEACRVVKLTEGKWKPAIKDWKPVVANMELPFHFATM